ncbi:MAG: hypothetical protein ACKVWR_21470 [Acidimicrobiales bacterium]
MTRVRALPAAAVALLALGACSASEGEAELGAPVATAAVSTSTPPASSDAPGSLPRAPQFTGDANSPFCQTVAASAGAGVDLGGARSVGPDLLRAMTESAATLYSSLAPLAPADIAPDVAVLDSLVSRFRSVLVAEGYDVGKLLAAAPPELAELRDPAVAEANARVSAYTAQVCGVALPAMPLG